jgi:8-oxo-dGTP pyrophosphatase MutT (NUDIX family)
MEMFFDRSHAPLRAAATVVMLRDGAGGLEVFLVRRHGMSDVLGGAYVFPGGKVDLADAEFDEEAHLDASPAALHAALHEPELTEEAAKALYVAALREAFEETGVLFAQGAGAAQAAMAMELLKEGRGFDEVIAMMRARLTTASLQPWSRWITPLKGAVMQNKRFDTRFFLAAPPPGQEASHDNHEAIASVWLAPRRALEQYREGEIELAPPQILSLAHLARHASVQSAFDEARGRTPPVILPEAFEDEEERYMCYPGDARHSVKERALPVPTRIYLRANKRFEPEGGWGALFD